MLLSSLKGYKMYLRFIKFFGLDLYVISSTKTPTPGVVNNRKSVLIYPFHTYQDSNLCRKQCSIPFLKQYSTSIQPQRLGKEGVSRLILLRKLESALRESKDEEAWKVFNAFRRLYGFPTPSLVSKLINILSYSSDHHSLHKACDLAFKIAKEKSELLQHDSLSRLCLSLARAQMIVPLSKIIRLMLQKNNPPTMDILCSVFMHMVKTEEGTYVASNILLEICDCFHRLNSKKSECALYMKLSTMIFNLILDACVRFGSSLKGQQIIEAMAQAGVIADAHSIVIFTSIYEMNGQRDVLKKFKDYVDRVSIPFARHYSQFYDKLLSLHYKFDDLNAATSLVEDMYFLWGSRPIQENTDLIKPCPVPIGSSYLKEGLKVQVLFELFQKESFFHAKGEEDFVVFRNGKLVLSSKGLAQLIVKYKKKGRICELSKLLAAIDKETGNSQEVSLCFEVIHACIYTGWLETAHDILDDMEIANIRVPNMIYMLLLNAYYRENMPKEAEALEKQIKRLGLHLDESHVITSGQSELAVYLVQEMKREDQTHSKVHELNSSIYFFCKAKMMDDARKAYRKMQVINIQPTVQTFTYLMQCYSSLEMYREITILWGEIKRYMDCGNSLANRDLYELLLLNFIRGGYFERVLEVIGHMKEHGMCADIWMYKNEFLRLHKNLYRRLKATDAKTEAQRLRLEHVKAFRKWLRSN